MLPALLTAARSKCPAVERLGVGGIAETFVAIRCGPGGFEQRVCLKRILPTFVNDADFGIAKATNHQGSVQSGALKGKIPYIN